MPELPEAENISRALHRALAGRTITKVEVFSPSLRTPLTPLSSAALEGHVITSVYRRGRYAIAALDDGRGLMLHFGMSGVVRVESADVPRRKHEHLFLHLDDGRIFRFEDPRRFGMAECHKLNDQGFPPVLDSLGPEPLTEAFNARQLHAALKGRRTPVKVLLMDNAVVTGIGNIYAAEALFAAGIRPQRPGSSITLKECGALVEAVKEILPRAIAAGGSTIADFRNVDGSEGYFARQLLIYGREGEKCTRCGTAAESVKLGGRSSCYCPKCQK
ncbi:MAG: bifunctional DNA-formamidopyrimidine glycosylase/DNA-(apurinic or apyrimidinic site) lyase [Victivallales bacterium]|nr:bifunctional DNA-formamidopyrimidine glycosylase/DNA-(apurinic or apyrimidinic site) lyase [Victivallales bacterium]